MQYVYIVFTIHCFPLSRKSMTIIPCVSYQTIAITSPADGFVFAFSGIGSPFAIHCFDCCLISSVVMDSKSHQWLYSDTMIQLDYAYTEPNNQLNHPFYSGLFLIQVFFKSGVIKHPFSTQLSLQNVM